MNEPAIPAPEVVARNPVQAEVCCSESWEQAYARFETPDQERRKFIARLKSLGAAEWSRDVRVVELCCGRGNGLNALWELGFRRVEGVDLSATLLAQYVGPAATVVGDCRSLPMPDASRDVVIVQGGLHHLPTLPGDLERTLSEVRRVLTPGGRFVVVEPWDTAFLRFAHAVCHVRLVRRLSRMFDAMATMIDEEEETYFKWLKQPELILGLLRNSFEVERCWFSWGKIRFVGLNRHQTA